MCDLSYGISLVLVLPICADRPAETDPNLFSDQLIQLTISGSRVAYRPGIK